ncbi:MAG: cystathionine gamma-synthase family protein [Polyangiaceae bacterium]|nr:cystathionine gamma-synthase family protein [Polyangiaceae bacterium]
MDRKHSCSQFAFNPETLALGLGYDPFRSEGAVKPPAFLTSTFQFRTAEEGKHYFELAYGLKEREEKDIDGLIYSRLNNPNLQIFEERLAAWDGTDAGSVFASGMAAISTLSLTLLKPGDYILCSAPVYGGTHYLFEHILPKFDIHTIQVHGGNNTAQLMREAAAKVGKDKVRMLFLETPANPSNTMVDIESIAALADELSAGADRRVITAVDNTFMGPIFQSPAKHGADLVIYSATKFIGGHSDLIAGVVTGKKKVMDELMLMRTILGTMANPFSGWLLLRSLETVAVRMRRQAETAQKVAEMLAAHPQVNRVCYPGLLEKGDPQRAIYDKQCTGPGALIAFEINGGEKAAMAALNRFEVARLAVSLGGTESLVQLPYCMTHSDVPPEQLESFGVTAGLVRMSVGLEHPEDLIHDCEQALKVD